MVIGFDDGGVGSGGGVVTGLVILDVVFGFLGLGGWSRLLTFFRILGSSLLYVCTILERCPVRFFIVASSYLALNMFVKLIVKVFIPSTNTI